MIEKEIKAALIDRLIERGDLAEDAVLVNEMAVADKERRADLVVANGKMHAFEVKSDADKLDRLEGQLRIYADYFDKVTVVCGPKHVEEILSSTPPNVEVWFVDRDEASSSVHWKVSRRGTANPVADREKLASFLPKPELARTLRAHGICCSSEFTRAEMIEWVDALPLAALRRAVLKFVKSRYVEANTDFMKRRGRRLTKAKDLALLSLYRSKRRTAQKCNFSDSELDSESQSTASLNPRAIDITRIPGAREDGDSKPIYILPKG